MSYPNSAKTGAEVFLEQLECQGVECIFASPIAVMAPIWEALARHGIVIGHVLHLGLAHGMIQPESGEKEESGR